MRPPINRVLLPAKHLQPCLAFLSGQNAAALRELDAKTSRLIRERKIGAGSLGWRKASDAAVQRLRERALRNIGATPVARLFIEAMRRQRLTVDRAYQGWGEVWHFLHSHYPDLRKWIGVCPWCGRLFARYHLRDIHCSTLCRMHQQLLHGSTDRVARELSDLLDVLQAVTDRSKRQVGPLAVLTQQLEKKSHRLLLDAVLRGWSEPFAFPEDVTDPEAFCAVWAFLFGSFPELQERVRVCPVCDRLHWRRDQRMLVCSPACRKRRHKQKKRAAAKPAVRRPRRRRSK